MIRGKDEDSPKISIDFPKAGSRHTAAVNVTGMGNQ
jgi:hypothetical protein